MTMTSRKQASFLIRTPIWSEEAVGLAAHKLAPVNVVRIDYRDKHGDKVYPFVYKITGKNAKTYPTKKQGYITLHIVPIAAMEKVW